MEWSKLYNTDAQPDFAAMDEFVGSELWPKLHSYLQERYKSQPKITYSKCSAQSGWNVKYQKSGKSLCTLYPMNGFFIALIVIGNKETTETELLLPSLSEYTQNLYASTRFSCGGRWLMMSIRTDEVLEDAKKLIGLRASCK